MNKLVKKNNRGAALISILIAVTFITIIATSLLYISASNYKMKVANSESKKNFYKGEGELMALSTKLRSSLTTSTDPMVVLQEYQVDATHYNCTSLAKAIDPDPSADAIAFVDPTTASSTYSHLNYKQNTGFYKYDVNVKSSNNVIEYYKYNASSTNADKWEAYSGSNMNNGLFKIVFKDVVIEQTSSNSDNSTFDYFDNSIKSDIVIQVARTTSTKEAGGIGDFSILMDDQLLINGADFSTMNVYGNSMTAKYEYNPSLGITTPVNSGGNPDNAGLCLKGDNRVNIMGDYFVVFGDIVLDDESSLYLNGTNLMVYGNIYLKGKSALICSSDSSICMVGKSGKNDISLYSASDIEESKLPGYDSITNIICADDNYAKHVYPKDVEIKRLNKTDSYDEYSTLMHFDDTNKDNDGVLKNILNTENNAADHKINIKDVKGNGSIQTDFYGDPCYFKYSDANTQNGGMKDSLIFLTYDPDAQKKYWSGAPDYVLLQQSNINSTIISTAPLNVDQKHTITLSKLGPEKFDWMTLPHDTDSYKKTNAIHDFEIIAKPATGGEVKAKVSVGDFFTNATVGETVYDPNSLVKALLGCSSDSKADKPKPSKTSMYLENWTKDL